MVLYKSVLVLLFSSQLISLVWYPLWGGVGGGGGLQGEKTAVTDLEMNAFSNTQKTLLAGACPCSTLLHTPSLPAQEYVLVVQLFSED